ncbi:MAG: TadE/TadG family type IV pilus assembly protein [Acidimicrobiia bacterium]
MSSRRGRSPDRRFSELAQATAEFALVMPLLVAAALSVLQIGALARDQLGVVAAAREAARAGSVDPDPEAPQRAAGRVLPGVAVRVGRRPAVGQFLEIEASYPSRTSVPFVGALFPDPVLRSSAVMRVER